MGTGRLGLYIDATYRVSTDGGRRRVQTTSECLQFLRFACAVGASFDSLVLFGREAPANMATEYALPLEGTIDVAPLPYYADLHHVLQVLRAVRGVLQGMWRGLDKVDIVWVFGPYPFSLALVAFALMRRRHVVLGVRQDTMRYYRSRIRSRWMLPTLAPLWLIDRLYRTLARRLPTTTVGREIERRYGGPRENVLQHVVSVVPRDEIVDGPAQPSQDGRIRLLTVGRIDSEKTPLMVVECLATLDRVTPGRFELTWAGDGPMAVAMAERAAGLGVASRLRLPGYVPFGPGLIALYRDSDIFVHSSLTEGVPQVLVEAMAAGLPIVATDVGGVSALLGDAAGGLVPPGDRDALVRSVLSLSDDQVRRRSCAERGLKRARDLSLEAQAARVAGFIGAST